MAQEFLFRFLSIRPANPELKLERAPSRVPLYTPKTRTSDFRSAVARVQGTPDAEKAIPGFVANFRQSGQAVTSLQDLKFPLAAAADWALSHVRLKVSDPAVKSGIESTLGQSLTKLVAANDLQSALGRVAETIYAVSLIPRAGGRQSYDRLVLGHKVLVFLMQLASGQALPADATVGDVVGARTVIVPPSPTAGQSKPPQEEPPPPPKDPRQAQIEEAKVKLALYEQAHREIANITVRPGSLVPSEPEKTAVDSRLAVLEQHIRQIEAQRPAAAEKDNSGQSAGDPLIASRLSLSPQAAAMLSETSKKALAELKLPAEKLDPIFAVSQIERQMSVLGAELASFEAPATYVMMGKVQLEKNKFIDSLAIGKYLGVPPFLINSSCNFQAGVGDLLMVKQKLKAYELGEFAYVENVLAGETRDREHRRLDMSEQTVTTEQETDTEKETDHQRTQPNKMHH